MKKRIPKKITLDYLEISAIKYLEKYSSSEKQLINILKRKIIKSCFFYKINPEEKFILIDNVINKLKSIGLINDKKFSENKVLNYVYKGYSRKKIFFKLKQKNISDENINNAIKNLNKNFFDYELASAIIFAKKKNFLSFKKKDQKEKEKKLIKLSQAGFNYDISKKIINIKNEKELLDLEKFANEGSS